MTRVVKTAWHAESGRELITLGSDGKVRVLPYEISGESELRELADACVEAANEMEYANTRNSHSHAQL